MITHTLPTSSFEDSISRLVALSSESKLLFEEPRRGGLRLVSLSSESKLLFEELKRGGIRLVALASESKLLSESTVC